MLPEGHRLHVVLEGISRGFSAVNIRKFTVRAHRLQSLVELGSLSPRAAAFLEASVRAGLNILVAGGTQAGKTTMLNCLGAAIPGGERVVSAEEVYELPNMSRIQTCERLSTSDKAWTGPARAPRSRASARTASSSVAERGWDVVAVWVENDTSARHASRGRSTREMLAAIERGEADVLVAWHVDRLTRKLTELEHLIVVAEKTGLRIATVTGDVDLSTDAGRLVGRILASVARGEVERKGARQKRAQQQAAQQGRPAGGRRAFGYGADGMTWSRTRPHWSRTPTPTC